MANPKDPTFSFSEFPEDIQLCILSFLSPPEVANFACTSKRLLSLCRTDSKLWFSLCQRRWGSKTQINKWGGGNITYKLLYKTLNHWENLIGIWRRCGRPNHSGQFPWLIVFEWGPSFVCGSRVCPSNNGTYNVSKAPVLWMGLSSDGQITNFLDLEAQSEIPSGDFDSWMEFVCLDQNLVPVNLNFLGEEHFIMEENSTFWNISKSKDGFKRSSSSMNLFDDGEEVNVVGAESGSPGSLPDRLVSEMYTHFANRTSLGGGGDRAWRRQRKKEKERQARRKWEPEHFLKVVDCLPTPDKPLQGLWKGISGDMKLNFYLVKYDEMGIVCQKVADLPSSYAPPVFWTSEPKFMESPFSPEEEHMYDVRMHLKPVATEDHSHSQCVMTGIEMVSHILRITSRFDITVPAFMGSASPQYGEGRVWQYKNGTFGFGFLEDHYIIDVKHIIQDGSLDSMNLL